MIIEYKSDPPTHELKIGKYTAYFYNRGGKRDTNIVWELWSIIEALSDERTCSIEIKDKVIVNFRETLTESLKAIYAILKYAYENKSSRSKCDIFINDKFIEITNGGVFPNIIICLEN